MQKSKSRYRYPFQNPKLPIKKRIDNIIQLMTLDEKIVCLGTNPSVPRLGIKACGHVEGLHGLAMGGPSDWGSRNPVSTTIFPQAIGLAETWDPELIRQIGRAEGYEIRYLYQSKKYKRGGLVIRSPNADLGRDPRWGRTEECYGEDPYFNGVMAVAMIQGLQGNHKKYWLTASLMKHFLANSNEDDRGKSSSNFDTRLFHEYYSVPFRMGVVQGKSNAFMAAYNAYNGIPMTVHPVLKDITMNDWGVTGIICTDGGALRLLISDHNYFKEPSQGAAVAIKMGINQFLDRYTDAVNEALTKNYLSVSDIDTALRGSFRVMLRLGLLDPQEMVPYSRIGQGKEPWISDKHRDLARLATQKSIVLLKNNKHLLPLDKTKLNSIAVIGPRADKVMLDWYSGTPPYTISPLSGIKQKVGKKVRVKFAYDNKHNVAVTIAKSAEVAIVCVGNHPTANTQFGIPGLASEGKEAVDRKSIILEQEDLIKKVYAVNPNTIVVLISSFPYAIKWTQNHIPAILHMTHCSQETGSALADVLFGDYNPAGRLVQTWPRSLSQLPSMLNYDITDGRTYLYFKGEPLYPFGYGLSYTKFAYSNLRLSSRTLHSDGKIAVKVDITNTGSRVGEEVVQMYIKHLDSDIVRPLKELKGFKRISINPGKTRTVTLELAGKQLAYWDSRLRGNDVIPAKAGSKFMVEPGRIKVLIGSSSADIKVKAVLRVVLSPKS
ncbi:MAG: glycoside hydrolase family 3 C-terminal domain-containing protein [bacterium]